MFGDYDRQIRKEARMMKNHPASRLWMALRCRRFLSRRGCLHVNAIPTHLTSAEKLRLYDLANGQGGICVEVGSYLGASSCFIALALLEGKTPGHLYCVDTWQNDTMTEGERDTFALFEQNTKPFRHVLTPLRGDSATVARGFDRKIDFLFIDGDHSHGGVRKDILSWFPHLTPGALVAFHDIGWAPGVQQAVREWVAPHAARSGRLPNLYWTWLKP